MQNFNSYHKLIELAKTENVSGDTRPRRNLQQSPVLFQPGARQDALIAFQSPISGIGVKTNIEIPKDQHIVKYEGKRVNEDEREQLSRVYARIGLKGFYFFQLDNEYHIDGTVHGNIACV
jgi:hypothetical protein